MPESCPPSAEIVDCVCSVALKAMDPPSRHQVGKPKDSIAAAGLNAGWIPNATINLSGADLQRYANNLAEAIFQGTYDRPSSLGPASAQEVLKATLPVSVVVDGVTVSRVVEQPHRAAAPTQRRILDMPITRIRFLETVA